MSWSFSVKRKQKKKELKRNALFEGKKSRKRKEKKK
jgi:hypothetical protein